MWSPVQDGNIEGLELTSSHGRTKTTVTPKQFLLEENQKSGEQLLHIRQTRKKKKKPHTINNLSIIVESAPKEIREFCNWSHN